MIKQEKNLVKINNEVEDLEEDMIKVLTQKKYLTCFLVEEYLNLNKEENKDRVNIIKEEIQMAIIGDIMKTKEMKIL